MLIARERTGWGPSLSATAPKRPGTPRSCSPQASDVAWGFYPDDHNPHRVGYVTVTDGLSGHRYTYWVEPRWLDGYLRGVEGCCDASDGPPAPSPPHVLVPAGGGAPGEWDDERSERAKITSWQLTGNGWSVTRNYLLAHPVIE